MLKIKKKMHAIVMASSLVGGLHLDASRMTDYGWVLVLFIGLLSITG